MLRDEQLAVEFCPAEGSVVVQEMGLANQERELDILLLMKEPERRLDA